MSKSWSSRMRINAAAAVLLICTLAKPTYALHVGQEVCVSGFITCFDCNVGRLSAYNTAYNMFQSISNPQDHNLQCLLENESCVSDGYEIVTKYSIGSQHNKDDDSHVYCRSFRLDSNSSSFIAAAGLGEFSFDSYVKVGGIPVSFAGQIAELGDTLTSLATVALDTETLSLSMGGCARETVPNHCIISQPGSIQYNPAPSPNAISTTSSPSEEPVTPEPATPSTQNASSYYISAIAEPTSTVIPNQVSTTAPPTANLQSIEPTALSSTTSTAANAAQLSNPSSPSGSPSTSTSPTFILLDSSTTSSTTNIQNIEQSASSTTTSSTTIAAQLSKPLSPSGAPSTSTSPTFISLDSFMTMSTASTTSSTTNIQSMETSSSSTTTSSTTNASHSSKSLSPSGAPITSTSPTFTLGSFITMSSAPTINATNATASINSLKSESNDNTISDDTEIKKLFRYHGQLAGASWGILVPLAMAAAWFRELFPAAKVDGANACARRLSNQLWLTIHAGLTIVAVVLTSTSVYFVVKALSMEGGFEYAAKFNGPHQTMGLFLLVGVWIQVLGGILRPKINHTGHVKMPLGASDEENRRDDEYIDSEDDSFTTDSTSSVRPGVLTHKWRTSSNAIGANAGEHQEALELEFDAKKSKARQVWDYGHRILAVTLLICGFWQLFSGLEAYQERFGDDSYLVTICMIWVGVFWTVVLVLTCFFKKF